ncbi:class A beta-lactamase-related serine hydrolase [Anaerobacillus alkaliphilus]|uniref:Class A beta-lactamase-related serine hydrolase n=2 Tax=Anaerobacillus alkaliphilus TaxID=1548597 RepID=A0A4Q0W282_9BACI|nr:class A beta-lactamase-related serine hydrolase [Anaerobacillus alkaliphilus]
MKEHHIPGCAVAVSQKGKVIYKKGFGYRDMITKRPVTPETIFGVASVTKSFTALSIMKLEEEGHLSVDDPVVQHLPEFKLVGVEDISTIKIHHLLTHTTGLAPMFRREELRKLKHHIAYLADKEYERLGEPGEYFSYCNDTFLLLGAIIEKYTGKLYRRYVTESILNPLGMYRSTLSIDELGKYENVSIPYDYNKKTLQLEEKPWPKLGNYEIGGGIRSTVLDLLEYGQVYINGGKGLLSEEKVKKMWENPFKVRENTYYGFALQVTPNYANGTLIEHGGGQPGVSSNFGFIPEQKLVVSVLCNVSNVPVDEIWLAAVNTALGLPMDQKRTTEPVYEISEERLSQFLGAYDSSEGGKAVIFLENGLPMLEVNEETFALRASNENTLVIESNGKPLTFYTTGNDKAWGLLLGFRVLTRKRSWVPGT